jgi:hypothetical protein
MHAMMGVGITAETGNGNADEEFARMYVTASPTKIRSLPKSKPSSNRSSHSQNKHSISTHSANKKPAYVFELNKPKSPKPNSCP